MKIIDIVLNGSLKMIKIYANGAGEEKRTVTDMRFRNPYMSVRLSVGTIRPTSMNLFNSVV